LHPARNGGLDLRYRVDFGDKCRRETCREAKIFDGLTPDAKRSWLCLASGLDAFAYSSSIQNPLFTMMGWGKEVLEWISNNGPALSRDDFFRRYPFFLTPLNPFGHAYLLSRILMTGKGDPLTLSETFRGRFERLSLDLGRVLGEMPLRSGQIVFTHLLPLDRTFLDFLRLTCGIKRLSLGTAVSMKAVVDRKLEGFTEVLLRRSVS